ncbi:tRNA1(Val) (adenine(37)-N6)-methyltransferase [Tatumella saanichensis]|uniref:tRNA1(Val) (adenine(37)-N6)-methyltransferase n=1 Tax=Tatumella saanichensis TaxID=480813 RepID=UPI0004A3A287|nr:methyltransferase [Tatumella saanichensis]
MPGTHALRKNGFTFRQFFVAHDQCGMKVSTDGIILGAAAPLPTQGPVLDIGSGSGLIALMLAQRLQTAGQAVTVEGVELDAAAVRQSRQNVAESPWAAAIQIHQGDILQWDPAFSRRYGLIVSNPPYFSPGVACRNDARATARYTDSLTHEALLETARQRLLPTGQFCTILPVEAGESLVTLAEQQGWFLRGLTLISELPQRKAHRLISVLSRQPGAVTHQQLMIRDDVQQYSAAYRQLTEAFYLRKSG